MVGCNMRFSSEVEEIPRDTRYISVYFGYNLKKWRPESDHLASYSSNKSQGGGVLLDAIHELDYLYYKFGSIKSIAYEVRRLTDITVDCEDMATGSIVFSNGTVADFSLNYLCDEYTRYYDVLIDNTIRRQFLTVDNQMYIDELNYFINCLSRQVAPMNNFTEAHYLLKKIDEFHHK